MAIPRFEILGDLVGVEVVAVGAQDPRTRAASEEVRSGSMAQDEGLRYDPAGEPQGAASGAALVRGPRHRSQGVQAQAVRRGELVTMRKGSRTRFAVCVDN